MIMINRIVQVPTVAMVVVATVAMVVRQYCLIPLLNCYRFLCSLKHCQLSGIFNHIHKHTFFRPKIQNRCLSVLLTTPTNRQPFRPDFKPSETTAQDLSEDGTRLCRNFAPKTANFGPTVNSDCELLSKKPHTHTHTHTTCMKYLISFLFL